MERLEELDPSHFRVNSWRLRSCWLTGVGLMGLLGGLTIMAHFGAVKSPEYAQLKDSPRLTSSVATPLAVGSGAGTYKSSRLGMSTLNLKPPQLTLNEGRQMLTSGRLSQVTRVLRRTSKSNLTVRSHLNPRTWNMPANQAGAPLVPIPGGAQNGVGNFNAVSCSTSNLCVAVGADGNHVGVVATSSNDGLSWNLSSVSAGEPELNALHCVSVDQCVAVGRGATATSSDGGVTWSNHDIPTANTELLSVSCSSASTCISVGVAPNDVGPLEGRVLSSVDGGVTWTIPTLPRNVGAIGSVDCPSATFCVAVGAQILVSTNGGTSWSPRFVSGGMEVLRSVSCSSSTVCVAIGSNPLGVSSPGSAALAIITQDGGIHWRQVKMPTGSWTASAITCFGGSKCIAAGQSLGQSLAPSWMSSNGGASWVRSSSLGGVSAIGSIDCHSSSRCVLVGLDNMSPVSGTSRDGTKWSIDPVGSAVRTRLSVAQ